MERVVESRIIHQGRYLTFRVDTVELADGTRATRDIAGHPGAVAIVALDAEGRVALVRQWRLPTEGTLLEIPAGGLDVHADGSREDPALAAPRELEEETGLQARSWRRLTSFYTAPGFTDELMHLYLATGLEPATADGRLGPDADERLILEWLPWREAVAAVERGEIRDAKSMVGLFWLARLLDGTDVASAAGGPDPAGPADRPDQAAPTALTATFRDVDSIDVHYRMTIGEFVRASVVLARRSVGMRFMAVLMIVAGLVPAVLYRDLLSVVGVIAGISLLGGWFVAPLSWFQARRHPELATAEAVFTADEAGIEVGSPADPRRLAWAEVKRLSQAGDYLVIGPGTGIGIAVPQRSMSADERARLDRLLERHQVSR